MLPFGYPTAANFKYGYSNQANFGIEHDFGNNFTVSLQYNFNGGRRLNRPINANTSIGSILTQNWYNAMTDPNVTAAQKADFYNNPLSVDIAGVNPVVAAKCGSAACGAYIPPALVSFFRPSGFNATLQYYAPPQVNGLAQQVLNYYHLGYGNQVIPFSDMVANYSNGTSDYNAFTVNATRRFSGHWEMLASYTWGHAIDDSTDLQATLEPQNNYNPNADRSNSLFDLRHRFVFSAVYQSNSQGSGFKGALLSNWTVAPIIEVAQRTPLQHRQRLRSEPRLLRRDRSPDDCARRTDRLLRRRGGGLEVFAHRIPHSRLASRTCWSREWFRNSTATWRATPAPSR